METPSVTQPNEAGVRWMFVSTAAQLDKVRQVRAELPDLQGVVVFDPPAAGGDAASWDDFLSLTGGGDYAFALAFPLAGLLIGYLLSPPYVLSPVPAAHPHRGQKIVSAVAVAQQHTGAVICCLIFPLGDYLVAGDFGLLGAVLSIVVVLAVMLELGKRFLEKHATAPAATATTPVAPAAEGVS